MPAFRKAFASGPLPVVVALAWVCGPGSASAAAAEQAGAKPGNKVENSSLDAPLFYQLLLGEIELREGQAGTAYQLMIDAARRTKDEQLFRRATEIALLARAGDQALSATLAWRGCPNRATRCATRSRSSSRSTASPTSTSRSRSCSSAPRGLRCRR